MPHVGPALPLSEMCRLQGLPEDFLADAPFTSSAKRQAIGNGVPLPMGRAIAKAVKAALALCDEHAEKHRNICEESVGPTDRSPNEIR